MLEPRYVRVDHIVWNTVDDEVVVLDPVERVYFGLNPTAAAVWQVLDEPKTAQEISDHLQIQFSTDSAEDVLEDTLDLLNTLMEKHLITKIG